MPWSYPSRNGDLQAKLGATDSDLVGPLRELFPSPEPNTKDIEDHLRREAAPYLPDRLEQVLRLRGSLRPVDAVEDVYGEMIGRARATHARAAIEQLHEAALVDDDGRGAFWNRTIRWTGS